MGETAMVAATVGPLRSMVATRSRARMTETSESSGRVERVFTVGIFLFVVGRALVIWTPLRDGNVNPWIFLALDLGTAYPYAVSFPRLYSAIRERRVDRIAAWAAVLTGSLLLPYAYVAAVGENVATWVWIVLGLFLLAAVISATIRIRKLIGGARV